jgi:tRNA (guanine-N7-)-methyltransferase
LNSETDFGIPIPGRVLPPDEWARTAIKRLPPPGPLDWTAIFGREAQVVLDLGCGNGRFTITSALARPELNHLGVDILPLVIRYATRRANQRGLANVRLAVIGGYELLDEYVAPASALEIHVYHPQPYQDTERHHRRLITPEFLALVHRSLSPGGLFVVQTDNPAYWQYIRRVAPLLFEFEEVTGPWPDAPQGRTRREIYARQHGLPIFRGKGRPRPQLPPERIAEIVRQEPAPDFDARGPNRGR